jgi:hypothetical protein
MALLATAFCFDRSSQSLAAEEPALPADLVLVPSDTEIFFRIQIAGFWQSQIFQMLRKGSDSDPALWTRFEKEFVKTYGMRPDDVAALTFACFPIPGEKDSQGAVLIATASKDIDREAVIKAMLPGADEIQHQGKTLFVAEKNDSVIHFADKRTLAYATLPNMRCFLEAKERASLKGPLGPALRIASGKHHLVIGARGNPKELPEKEEEFSGLKFPPMRDLRIMVVVVDLGEKKAQAAFSFTFMDEAKAKVAADEVKDFFGKIKLWAAFASYAFIQSRDSDLALMALPLKKVIDAVKDIAPKRKGAIYRVDLESAMTSDEYVSLARGFLRLASDKPKIE